MAHHTSFGKTKLFNASGYGLTRCPANIPLNDLLEIIDKGTGGKTTAIQNRPDNIGNGAFDEISLIYHGNDVYSMEKSVV